jgi:hypothetical protein
MPNHAALDHPWVEGHPKHYIPSPALATTRIDETSFVSPTLTRVGLEACGVSSSSTIVVRRSARCSRNYSQRRTSNRLIPPPQSILPRV